MISYKVNYLNSREGIGKASKRPFWMMTGLFTIMENDRVIQSYTANVFLDEDQYKFVSELSPMQELDAIFLPTSRGVQLIQLDIVG
ncbi:MAG: hypothetical protein ACI4C4_07125 [Lachnospiraceae bacterium]